MNTIIAAIIVATAIGVVLAVAVKILWDVLEYTYRIAMLVFYSIAYVLVTIWEVVTWLLYLPVRIVRWILAMAKTPEEGLIDA